jgi:ATP-dependent HslUV protease ATP-binding subunit HslU
MTTDQQDQPVDLSLSSEMTPREIVAALNRYIVGQDDAKRAVAVALRNRVRRQYTPEDLRDEIIPKNILMIGPTGVGKTEIARRLAQLARAPFLKVEATKFTEVGYVGRDVDSIVRDLADISYRMVEKEHIRRVRPEAERLAHERLVEILTGGGPEDDEPSFPWSMPGMPGPDPEIQSPEAATAERQRREEQARQHEKVRRFTAQRLEAGELEDQEIELEAISSDAVERVEQGGIVFLDELDKVAGREGGHGPEVSREGVQRDILPIIEGSTVQTKYGPVDTNHVLFICAGAFHVSKPSDLIPELQGRLPIRVELDSLSGEDFRRILTEPANSLVRQYTELLATEGVTITFTDDALTHIADLAQEVNEQTENIGARRLYTLMERLLEELSFEAPDLRDQEISIDVEYVDRQVGDLVGDEDLSRYML